MVAVLDTKARTFSIYYDWKLEGSVNTQVQKPPCGFIRNISTIDIDDDHQPDFFLSCEGPEVTYIHWGDGSSQPEKWGWTSHFIPPSNYMHKVAALNMFNAGSFQIMTERTTALCEGSFGPCMRYMTLNILDRATHQYQAVRTTYIGKKKFSGTVDADSDGLLDLLTCDRAANLVYLEQFDSNPSLIVAQGDFKKAADLNRDGKQDLVVLDNGSLSIFENLSQ